MNRTLRAIIAVVFVGIIMFCAISICRNVGGSAGVDITQQRLYTLSDGTKSILKKINQPITLKLYYAKTAATKGPDQIQFFNDYYYFVRDLLKEYASVSAGMVKFEEVDPRPYSTEEEEALRYGLRRFQITEEESFFFGLVLQTQFGVTKSVSFFAPDRQNFIEYDVSYLIDTAITRQKKRIGVLSSLPIFGDEASEYMARMMQMQGQQPKPAWSIISHLRNRYEVTKIETEVEEISRDEVDTLLVIHPKELSETTLFAIDQFVLGGGAAIVLVDPHCLSDQPDPMQRQMPPGQHNASSELDLLLKAWNLRMPAETFAGDRALAIKAMLRPNSPAEKIIGFLQLGEGCFNADTVVTANLNDVKVMFAGALERQTTEPDVQGQEGLEILPLLLTTNRGNTWKARSPYDLMQMNTKGLMDSFRDGTEPVMMGCLVTGRLQSAFPDGIEITEEPSEGDPNGPAVSRKTGLVQAEGDCAVAVFSDVDFVSDIVAYQSSFFGTAPVGDNSALLLNTIENLSGSADLIAIRSRGNFKRPFTVVEEIERQAEQETAAEEANIQSEITAFEQELRKLVTQAREKGETLVDTSELADEKRDLQLQIAQARRRLRDVQNRRLKEIDKLGGTLQNINMLAAPATILVIVVILALRRSIRRRTYISHASDA